MAYSNSNSPGPAMGADSSSGGQMPDMHGGGDDMEKEEQSPEMEEKGTFFLPPSFVEKYDCQPGDRIMLEVVNVDKDGDKEVKVTDVMHGGGKRSKGGMMDELRSSADKIMPGMNQSQESEA